MRRALISSELNFDAACRYVREGHPDLFAQAAALRDQRFGRTLTYSPKVFLPVTNLCRDRCSYCTFRKGPKDDGAHTMSLDEVRQVIEDEKAGQARKGLLEGLAKVEQSLVDAQTPNPSEGGEEQ